MEKTNNFYNNHNYNEKRFLPSDRFVFSRVSVNSKEGIEKKASMPEMYENLEHELLWSDFMHYVTKSYPEAHLRAPDIYDIKEDKIVFEYIDSPLLCGANQTSTLNDSQFNRFVSTLVLFDKAGENWRSAKVMSDEHEHTPYNIVDKSWSEWLAYTKPAGLVTGGMEAEARQLVADYRGYIKPRMQHGDYKPWQIFDQGTDWVVFDGEHSSQTKPRYYDLAYVYARTFVIAQDDVNAKRLLGEFIRQHNNTDDNFFEAFLPVLMSRSMGMFLDAYMDIAKGGADYTASAYDLFDRCIKRDLSLLLTNQQSSLIQ